MDTFKILEGLPAHVSDDVNLLLSAGWTLNGPLFTRIVDNQTIVGQCLTYNRAPLTNYIFTLRINVSRQFDPNAILSVVYHRLLPHGHPIGTFNYMAKIRAADWESAEAAIQSELRIQIPDGDYDADVQRIDMAEDYV